MAAGPDNALFYTDPAGGHVLLDRGFYDAVAGRNWCWFFLNAPGLLADYTGYTWWPGLPAQNLQTFGNSEIFGLGVVARASPLVHLLPEPRLADAVAEARLPWAADPDGRWQDGEEVWFVYQRQDWERWDAMDPPFPVTGTVRPEYDYRGADAVIRVEAGVDRLSPGARAGAARDTVSWTAAAKPFGYLEMDGDRDLPNRYDLVQPAFRQVRLMPVDAASMPGGGSFDLDWRRHVVEHLPAYLAGGPSMLDGSCRFCARLATWEDAGFRREGVDWLSLHSDRCTVSSPGPGGRGGGTRRAHLP